MSERCLNKKKNEIIITNVILSANATWDRKQSGYNGIWIYLRLIMNSGRKRFHLRSDDRPSVDKQYQKQTNGISPLSGPENHLMTIDL